MFLFDSIFPSDNLVTQCITVGVYLCKLMYYNVTK